MKATRILLIATSVLLASVVALAIPPIASAADVNGCTARVDNPHISSGAGGIISKAHFSFTQPANITQDLYLWRCPSPAQKDETWIVQNCTQKAANTSDVPNMLANLDYVRYAPPSGQPGVHGTRYSIACTTWQSHTIVDSSVHITYSNSAQISDP